MLCCGIYYFIISRTTYNLWWLIIYFAGLIDSYEKFYHNTYTPGNRQLHKN
jgi:hypothetical protein